MTKLSNTEAELKKSVAYKNKHVCLLGCLVKAWLKLLGKVAMQSELQFLREFYLRHDGLFSQTMVF